MGEKTRETLKLQFDKRLRLEFHGTRNTSDAGLLACRELDGVLGLAEMAPTHLQETHGGRNVSGQDAAGLFVVFDGPLILAEVVVGCAPSVVGLSLFSCWFTAGRHAG